MKKQELEEKITLYKDLKHGTAIQLILLFFLFAVVLVYSSNNLIIFTMVLFAVIYYFFDVEKKLKIIRDGLGV